jgi:CPA2 family monovalent cation:H+ antiporter-2
MPEELSIARQSLQWGAARYEFESGVRRVESAVDFTLIPHGNIMPHLVSELLIILAAGLVAALACRRLQLPSLTGYLVAGAIVGKGVLGWVTDERHEIAHLAEAGVFLLLFSIGLEFSLSDLWRLGRHLVIGGGAQMLLVAVPVAAYLTRTGMAWQPAVLVASAVSFSSTVLVFKTLAEWGHSSRPHGQRAIGVLLFQDAALVPLLLVVPLLTASGTDVGFSEYATLTGVSLVFIVGVILLQRALSTWLIPRFTRYRSPELVVLFTLCVLGGVTFAAWKMGLPPAIGAFAAGLIFSGNRWSHQIDSLVLPFRETFSAIFFVSLGLLFDPQPVLNAPSATVGVLSALLVLKGFAAAVALRLTGLTWRSSFGMGVGLAHVGEFAFVLILLGAESGILSADDSQRVSTLAIASLMLTPVLLKTGLGWIRETERADVMDEAAHPLTGKLHSAVVIGAGPVGLRVSAHLETIGRDVCLVDLSPINLQPFAQQGMDTVAGDATDQSVLELADAGKADFVVISLPDDQTAIRVVKAVRSLNTHCFLLVRCRYESNVATMKKQGASAAVSEEVEVCKSLLNNLPSIGNFDRTPSHLSTAESATSSTTEDSMATNSATSSTHSAAAESGSSATPANAAPTHPG